MAECPQCGEIVEAGRPMTLHQMNKHPTLREPDARRTSPTSTGRSKGDAAKSVGLAYLGLVKEKPLIALIPVVVVLAVVFAVTNALGITESSSERREREAAEEAEAEAARAEFFGDETAGESEPQRSSSSRVGNDPEKLSAVRQFLYVNQWCATRSCPEVVAAGPSVFSFYVDVRPTSDAIAACSILLMFASDDVVVWSGTDRRAEGDPRHDVVCRAQ